MDPPLPVDPDDVLAQPTRARLFALLQELKRPVGTAELAERLGLHLNGVRVHLDRLRDAGLVASTRARQPRGRPRDMWTIARDARPGGASPQAYADLGRWLARTITTGSGHLRQVEATGRAIGREIAPRDTGASIKGPEALESTLAALGFQPHPRPGPRSGELTFCLGNCPYRDAVRESQEVICTLHRGLTRGLLDVLEPQAALAGFVPRDPDLAGCLIELTGVPAGATP